MKKLIYIAFLSISCLVSAQKKKKTDIMQSTNIQEIENFLKTAHPDDPRRIVLKPKLIALKNAAWTAGAKNAKPMEARPIVADIPKAVVNRPNSDEAEEFKKLIAESSNAQKSKTVKLLNTLFDQDINRKEAIILIQNNSDCNMIMRIQNAKDFYNLAVPTKGENSLIVKKGSYSFSSLVCGSQYKTDKEIKNNQLIILNNPTYTTERKSNETKIQLSK